jgi:REP element-mobilizing transposase RayT
MDISCFNSLLSPIMSLHSYFRCWIHLIWGTLNREKVLNKKAAARLSQYLTEYAEGKSVYMKINYVNADHVQTFIDLPTNLSIEDASTAKGQFLPLGQRQRYLGREICQGQRLWCFLCFGI